MANYKPPQAEMRKITDDVYLFIQKPVTFGMWISNAGVIIGKDDITIVDSLTNKYMVENLFNVIKEISNKPIRRVINTHYHGDHVYTNHLFKGADIIATQKCLEDTMNLHPYEHMAFSNYFPADLMNFEGAEINPQNFIFEGKLKINDGKREIQVIDLGAAHSGSDSIVYLPKEKVVFTADLIDERTPTVNLFAGSYRIIDVFNYLTALDVKYFLTGHGKGVHTREEITGYAAKIIEFLIIMREEARKCYDQGMTYQEAAEKIDYSKLQKWGEKKMLYGTVFANCARAWSEFNGEPLATWLDLPELFTKMLPRFPGISMPERFEIKPPELRKK